MQRTQHGEEFATVAAVAELLLSSGCERAEVSIEDQPKQLIRLAFEALLKRNNDGLQRLEQVIGIDVACTVAPSVDLNHRNLAQRL